MLQLSVSTTIDVSSHYLLTNLVNCTNICQQSIILVIKENKPSYLDNLKE